MLAGGIPPRLSPMSPMQERGFSVSTLSPKETVKTTLTYTTKAKIDTVHQHHPCHPH